ncbi:hypothetical protein SK128_003978, partial [Halocaridina rubra]
VWLYPEEGWARASCNSHWLLKTPWWSRRHCCILEVEGTKRMTFGTGEVRHKTVCLLLRGGAHVGAVFSPVLLASGSTSALSNTGNGCEVVLKNFMAEGKEGGGSPGRGRFPSNSPSLE